MNLTDAIAEKNMERAQEAKSAVEDAQRDMRKHLEEHGEKHVPRFFTQQPDGRWLPNIQSVTFIKTQSIVFHLRISPRLPDNIEEMVTAVQQWMWSAPP
jgi:hypothetical protein